MSKNPTKNVKKVSKYLKPEDSHNSEISNYLYSIGLDPGDFLKVLGFDLTVQDYAIKNPATYSREWSRDQRHGYVGTTRLIKHFEKDITIAMRRHACSKVYIVDIDNHDGETEQEMQDKLRAVIYTLGKPLKALYSPESGGYHFYYRFKEQLGKDIWKFVATHISRNKGITVETVIDKNVIRLPFSKSYSVYGEIEYIQDTFKYEIIQETPDKIIQDFLGDSCNYLPIAIVDIMQHISQYYKCLSASKKENGDYIFEYEDYTYGRGTRNNNQFMLTRIAEYEGKTFEDAVPWILSFHDGTSKDIAKWGYEGTYKELNRMWESVKKYNSNHGKLNINYITDKDLENHITEKEEKDLLYMTEEYFGNQLKMKGVALEKKRYGVVTFLKVIKYLFKRRMQDGVTYEDRYKNLEKGVPIPQSLRMKIAKKFGITQIGLIYNFLVKTRVIKALTTKEGFSYGYKNETFAKHFIINSIEKVVKWFKKSIEKLVEVVRSLSNVFASLPLFKFHSQKVEILTHEISNYYNKDSLIAERLLL